VPPTFGILLVDCEGDVGELAGGFKGGVEARAAGANDEDAQGAVRVQRFLVNVARSVKAAVPFVLVGLFRGGCGDFRTQGQRRDIGHGGIVVPVRGSAVLVTCSMGCHFGVLVDFF
jgi:hypothetical protein